MRVEVLLVKIPGSVFFASLLLAGCSGGSGEGGEFSQPSNPTVQALQGTFSDPCEPEGDGQGRRNTLEVDGNHMLFSMNTYADQSCSELMLGVRLGGDFTIGAAVDGIDAAYEMDAVLDQFDARVTSEEFAAGASSEGMMGISDWEADVPQSLFGLMGIDDGMPPIESGTRLYLMVKVDDQGVHFGDGDGPGLAPDDRGEALSDHPMVRMAR